MNIIADKRKNSRDIPELVNDGKIVMQPTDIANVLNMFFSSIGYKINNDLKQTVTTENSAWFLNPSGFKLQHVTCANVLMTLNNLSNNKKRWGNTNTNLYIQIVIVHNNQSTNVNYQQSY